MNEKLDKIYKYLQSQNIKNLPDSYEGFEDLMYDEEKAGKIHQFLLTKGIKNVDEDFDSFKGYVGLKKKEEIGGLLDVAKGGEESETYLPKDTVSGEGLPEAALQLTSEEAAEAPPVSTKPISFEETLPEDYTLRSLSKSGQRTTEFYKQEIASLENELTTKAQEIAQTAETQEEFDIEIAKLTEDVQGRAEKLPDEIESFKYLDPKDANTIEEEVATIMQAPDLDFQGKNEALERLTSLFVSQVPPDTQQPLRGEINRVIAKEAMTKGSRITPFAAKTEALKMQQEIREDNEALLREWARLFNKKDKEKTDAEKQREKDLYRQTQMYTQALRLTDKILRLPDDEGSFFEGLKAPWQDGTVQSLGISDVTDAAMQLKASKRVGRLEDTDADRAVLSALGLYQIGQQDIGDWYRRGEMLSDVLPFMAQFAASSGLVSAGSATAKKAATEAVKKTLAKKAAEFTLKTTKQAAIRTPLLTAGYQRALEGMRGQPTFDAETGTFVIDETTQESIVEGIAKGAFTNFTEAFFESGGEAVGKGVNMIAKRMGVTLPKAAPWMRQVKDKVAFNGFLGEFIEELPTEFFQSLVVEGNSFKEAFRSTKEAVPDILFTTAVISGGFGAVSAPGSIARAKKENRLVAQIGKESFGKIDEAVRGGNRDAVMEAMGAVWEGLSPEQRTEQAAKDILSYTGESVYEAVATVTQQGMTEDVNKELESQGLEPVQATLPFEETVTEEVAEPTTEETSVVQQEPKVGEEVVQKTEQMPTLKEIEEVEDKYTKEIDEYDAKIAKDVTGRDNLTEDEVTDVIVDLIRRGQYKEPTDLYEKRDKPFNMVVSAIQSSVGSAMGKLDSQGVLSVLGLSRRDTPSSLRGKWLENLGKKITLQDKKLSNSLQRAIGIELAESRGLDFDGIMGSASGLSPKQKQSFLGEVNNIAKRVVDGIVDIVNKTAKAETAGEGQTVVEGEEDGVRVRDDEKQSELETEGGEVTVKGEDGKVRVIVAPFYSTKVNSIEDARSLRESGAYQKHQQQIKDVAKEMGVSIASTSENIGGFVNEQGEKIIEVSNTVEVDGTIEQAEELAAVMGALTPEVQEATIAAAYVEPGSPSHNVDELTLKVSDVNEAINALKEADLYDFTINETDQTVSFLDFSQGEDLELKNKINKFVEELNKKGVNYEAQGRKAVDSRYIDPARRSDILRSIKEDAVRQKQGGPVFRSIISEAIKREQSFRGEEVAEPTSPKLATALRTAAEKLREGKINKPDVLRAGTGFDAAWDAAIEAMALALEGAATVTEAVAKGMAAIRDSEWYKNLTEEEKVEQGETIESSFKEQLDSLVSEGLEGTGETITPEKGKDTTEGKKSLKTEKTAPKQEKGADTKVRGAQKEGGSLRKGETPVQQTLDEIVDENKEVYQVQHFADAIEKAKAYIDKVGVEAATTELIANEGVDPIQQAARLVLIDFHVRTMANSTSEKAINNAKAAVTALQQTAARVGTRAGQSSAMMAMWSVMQPAGLLEYVRRRLDDANKKVLEEIPLGEVSMDDAMDIVQNVKGEMERTIVEELLQNKPLQDALAKVGKAMPRKPITKKMTLSKEKAREIRAERMGIKKELRAEAVKLAKGGNLPASLIPLPINERIVSLTGKLLASYGKEVYYTMSDIVERLRNDLKEAGFKVTDADIDTILSQRTGESNETWRSRIIEAETRRAVRQAMADAKLRIEDIIKEHYSVVDRAGRTLAQKLVDEGGLTMASAKEIETRVLKEFDRLVREKSEKQLRKRLGLEEKPEDTRADTKKKKNVIDKMIELLNMGAVNNQEFRDAYAEKFGLAKPMTAEQSKELIRLADIVQQTRGMGSLHVDAVRDMTSFIYELMPQSKRSEVMEEWMALAYASMLSGISTSIINMHSAYTNVVTSPLRDIMNPEYWALAVKTMVKGKKYTIEVDGKTITKKERPDIFNPFGKMFYIPLLWGTRYGGTAFRETMVKGALDSKYIEKLGNTGGFKVSFLERKRFGDKAFRPMKITFKGGKTVTVNNPKEYAKYVGRFLAAQDRLMFNGSFEMEVVKILRDKLKRPDLKGKALTDAVMEQYMSMRLNTEVIDQQTDVEIAKWEQITGKKATPLQRRIKRRELMLEELKLTPEEKMEAENLARSNIFTDERNGLMSKLIVDLVGGLTSKSKVMALGMFPWVPFRRIVANLTEFLLDSMPVYGLMRTYGLSVTGIAKKFGLAETSAQMGERGTREFYEQAGRAWFATSTALALALLAVGNDEDDFLEITGGYNDDIKRRAYGRDNVTPKYSIRLGDVTLSYVNTPVAAGMLGLVGNINDARRIRKVTEEEITTRTMLSILGSSYIRTFLMAKDTSPAQGLADFMEMAVDAVSQEGGLTKAGRTALEKYLSIGAKPLPQNINTLQQIWQAWDHTAYSKRDADELLAYTMGLHRLNNKPIIDQMGEEVQSYPAEMAVPYTHWANIKGNDTRWLFLAKHGAIPPVINNYAQIDMEYKGGIHSRRLDSDDLFEYALLSGKFFSEKLTDYMANEEKVANRSKEKIETKLEDRGWWWWRKDVPVYKTGVQADIQKLRSKAMSDARTALFYWGEVKEPDTGNKALDARISKGWDLIQEHKAYKAYTTSPPEFEGKPLTDSQMYEMNTRATVLYALDMAEYLSSPAVSRHKELMADKGRTVFDMITQQAWSAAKQRALGEMAQDVRKQREAEK
ncbi:MAG: hypothetical protein WC961_07105 [Anaerovoracaceae bacterium]